MKSIPVSVAVKSFEVGRLKRDFDRKKGYGFATIEGGVNHGKDVFLHEGNAYGVGIKDGVPVFANDMGWVPKQGEKIVFLLPNPHWQDGRFPAASPWALRETFYAVQRELAQAKRKVTENHQAVAVNSAATSQSVGSERNSTNSPVTVVASSPPQQGIPNEGDDEEVDRLLRWSLAADPAVLAAGVNGRNGNHGSKRNRRDWQRRAPVVCGT